jgi:hypothetical protein
MASSSQDLRKHEAMFTAFKSENISVVFYSHVEKGVGGRYHT